MSRYRRRSRPRSRTLSVKKLKVLRRVEARAVALVSALGLLPEEEMLRPRTRGECRDGVRPCPWVGCKYHLFIDVNPATGALKLNFPDIEPSDLAESCTLDLAERGHMSLEEVGGLMNVTREQVRNIEIKGLIRLRSKVASAR